MPTAFVLSGGGSLGAVQVGMLRALADHHLEPDVLVGASAGALNAAYVAGQGFDRPALDELADIWCSLRRQDVFPFGTRSDSSGCTRTRTSSSPRASARAPAELRADPGTAMPRWGGGPR